MIDREPSPTSLPATDPWPRLRRLTPARIGLGRSGVSLPTGAQLRFQLAHAEARDAVHGALDAPRLLADLAARGHDVLTAPLHSAAPDRQIYLQRPDLGRRLDDPSARVLAEHAIAQPDGYDAAVVVADGLSALAVERHAPPLLDALLPELRRAGWRLAPLAVVEQGRVAVADEIGALLGARLVVILLGERPGLSAPDSLGAYLTHAPRVGATDAERNCVSNIRAAGLGYADAARTLLYLMREALRREASGVALKDETERVSATGAELGRNFLVDDGARNGRRVP